MNKEELDLPTLKYIEFVFNLLEVTSPDKEIEAALMAPDALIVTADIVSAVADIASIDADVMVFDATIVSDINDRFSIDLEISELEISFPDVVISPFKSILMFGSTSLKYNL